MANLDFTTPTWNGPVDYTEVVYVIHCLSVAEAIKEDARSGKPVSRDELEWANRFQFVPNVNVTRPA